MSFFCSNCGKEISDGSRFCPSCGADTTSARGGSSNNYSNNLNNMSQNVSNNLNSASNSMGGTLTIILVLGILWAIWSFANGIWCIAGGGFVLIFPQIAAAFVVIGILSIVSGLFALLSCMRIYKLEKYKEASNYCLFGSIIALITGGIIIGIVGLVFWFLMKNEQSRFRS